MAKPSTDITPQELEELAYAYIDECLGNKKEHATNSGKVIEVKDRHIPTVDYFLRIWIPKQGKPTIHRSTYYNWLNDESEKESNNLKFDTIKNIDELFKTLATDIVANEGKGIFYAKNRLGMSDRVEQTHKGEVSPFTPFDIDVQEDNGTT
jgi:hypothetical protein